MRHNMWGWEEPLGSSCPISAEQRMLQLQGSCTPSSQGIFFSKAGKFHREFSSPHKSSCSLPSQNRFSFCTLGWSSVWCSPSLSSPAQPSPFSSRLLFTSSPWTWLCPAPGGFWMSLCRASLPSSPATAPPQAVEPSATVLSQHLVPSARGAAGLHSILWEMMCKDLTLVFVWIKPGAAALPAEFAPCYSRFRLRRPCRQRWGDVITPPSPEWAPARSGTCRRTVPSFNIYLTQASKDVSLFGNRLHNKIKHFLRARAKVNRKKTLCSEVRLGVFSKGLMS